MRVRDAVPTDLPAMVAIDSGLVGSERWAELEHLVKRGWVLLAEDLSDDSPVVVGYVAVGPKHFFGRDFIALLVVAEACRRRGTDVNSCAPPHSEQRRKQYSPPPMSPTTRCWNY